MSKTSSASILLPLPIIFLLLTVVCKPSTASTPCTPPPCQGKQSWPELVGKDQDTAYSVIKRENQQVTDVVFLVSDVLGRVLGKKGVLEAAGDGDSCCNRVVVVVGALPSGGEGVTKVPKVG